MIKSIIYKEWLKIKKVYLLLLAVGLLVVIGIYSNVRHELIVNDAESYWDLILNQKMIYFGVLKFLPLIMGLLIGVAQFVPETVEKRIKLTLHLPTNEETIVLKMVWFGAGSVLLLHILFISLFAFMGLYYFPIEIVSVALYTILPWFLAGIAAYFLTSFTILEPIWKQRIFYTLISGAFLTMFFKTAMPGAYQQVLVHLAILIACVSISTLFSIYRFRKGEM